MRASKFILLAAAAAATSASAAPLPGTFDEISPTAKRYPVTLVSSTWNMASCDASNFEQALDLVDNRGQIVQTGFPVPNLSTFVITDVSWDAYPPVGGFPFTPDKNVVLDIIPVYLGQRGMPQVRLYADRVTAEGASGNYAFSSGPAYSRNQTFCVRAGVPSPIAVNFLVPYSGLVSSVYVHGYVIDNS
jgi:hypothetical protein